MKRSEINQILRDAKALFARHSFRLPPLAEWTPEETRRRLAQCPEIRDCQLGWDVTDFGLGRFAEAGLLLFTIRWRREKLFNLPKHSLKRKITLLITLSMVFALGIMGIGSVVYVMRLNRENNREAMDALITNFHLPQSTLIMLVSAFAGRETILNAYGTAIENEYRFFSFGDAMMIL